VLGVCVWRWASLISPSKCLNYILKLYFPHPSVSSCQLFDCGVGKQMAMARNRSIYTIVCHVKRVFPHHFKSEWTGPQKARESAGEAMFCRMRGWVGGWGRGEQKLGRVRDTGHKAPGSLRRTHAKSLNPPGRMIHVTMSRCGAVHVTMSRCHDAGRAAESRGDKP
jgi:hypothetical protein